MNCFGRHSTSAEKQQQQQHVLKQLQEHIGIIELADSNSAHLFRITASMWPGNLPLFSPALMPVKFQQQPTSQSHCWESGLDLAAAAAAVIWTVAAAAASSQQWHKELTVHVLLRWRLPMH